MTNYAAGSGVEGSDWGGGFAPIGDAIRLTWPLISGAMSTTVSYGGTVGTVTRQAAWAKALRASVDSGRYNRQTIAPQALANGTNIYYANRAILLIDSTKALYESEAIRYLKESVGIQTWLGNDLATGGTDGVGGGPTATKGTAPYGPNWYMVTTRGTNKDGEGFDGSDYGEAGPQIYRMGLLSGDAQLQARALVETRARNQFRCPGADESGYLMLMAPEPIGDRNNDLPGHHVYLGGATPTIF